MADPSPPEHHDALPAGTRLGEFEIQHVVGVGGFGIVYRAHDHALQRTVALKEYLPVTLAGRDAGHGQRVSVRSSAHAETFGVGLRSFVNEARLLAQFDHPALLKVYRFWEDNGTAYMVMPFYEGSTLQATRRAMTGPPAEAWMRALLEPLLGALELMHRAQVFHRDIAPDNIILRPDGSPVLLDFGAARRVIGDRTQTLTAILKPNFAPIEQYAESTQFKQGAWTDLYALGAVVAFCATGRPPMPASVRVLHDELVPLPQLVRQGLLPWSLRMAEAWQATLCIKPSGRPQSVAGLRLLLQPGSAETDLLPTVVASVPPVPPVTGKVWPQTQQPPTVPVRRVRMRRFRHAGDAAAKVPGRSGTAAARPWLWALLAAPVGVAALWWGSASRPVAAAHPAPVGALAAAGPASATDLAPKAPAASEPDTVGAAAVPVPVPPAASQAAPADSAARVRPAPTVQETASHSAAPKRQPQRPRPVHEAALPPASPRPAPAPADQVLPAASVPSAVAAPPPPTPRQACGSRVFVALYRCMQRQCERPAMTAHPECVEWRRIEDSGRPRH
ncbi:MAG TPA: serine/threonine-protein kinase [Burkholderiaceae bacterium]|nr:serine/threonine-protein kinase [Burkholderiaceae bacterium]